jgi:hypothetical protein
MGGINLRWTQWLAVLQMTAGDIAFPDRFHTLKHSTCPETIKFADLFKLSLHHPRHSHRRLASLPVFPPHASSTPLRTPDSPNPGRAPRNPFRPVCPSTPAHSFTSPLWKCDLTVIARISWESMIVGSAVVYRERIAHTHPSLPHRAGRKGIWERYYSI